MIPRDIGLWNVSAVVCLCLGELVLSTVETKRQAAWKLPATMNGSKEDNQQRQLPITESNSDSNNNNSSSSSSSSINKNVSDMTIDSFCTFIENNIRSRRERLAHNSALLNEKKINVIENRVLSKELASMNGIHGHIKRTQIERKKRSDENDYRKDQFWV